jgi:hypothetical protein
VRAEIGVSFDKLHNAAFAGAPDSPAMADALAAARDAGIEDSGPVRGWDVSCDSRLFACEYPDLTVLTGGPGALPDRLGDPDPYGEDLQLALHLAYDLHYRAQPGVDPDLEWDPEVLRFRGSLEQVFLAALRADCTPSVDVEAALATWTGTRPQILALNPATPIDEVSPFLDHIDLLLCMTVVPGFGGQSFMSEVLPKISQAAQWRQDRGLAYHIEVDGGINPDTAALSIAAGANVLVAGSSVFSSADMAAVIRAMRA